MVVRPLYSHSNSRWLVAANVCEHVPAEPVGGAVVQPPPSPVLATPVQVQVAAAALLYVTPELQVSGAAEVSGRSGVTVVPLVAGR